MHGYGKNNEAIMEKITSAYRRNQKELAARILCTLLL